MSKMKLLALVAFAWGLAAQQSATQPTAQTCPAMTDGQRTSLAEYVQKKYKLPANTRLESTQVSTVEGTCYRKLAFQSADSHVVFHVELFATPDLRFLVKELLDSTVDPVVEERKKAELLTVALRGGDSPALGAADAPITVAVFSDFQCPYCAKFAALMKEALPDVQSKVRFVFRNLPLAMHPWARPAAEAAACAQEQGNQYFWSMHDFLFEHQSELNRDNLQQKLADYAKGIGGFDEGKFATCVIGRKTAARVGQDMDLAQQNGINSTPSTFVNGQRAQLGNAEQLRAIVRQFAAATPGVPNSSGLPAANTKQGR